MKTNNEIVNENLDLIRECCSFQMVKYSVPLNMYNDMVQDICLILLEYDNARLNRIYEGKHLNAFVTGILRNQLYSTNSKAYRTYRKFSNLTSDIDGTKVDVEDDAIPAMEEDPYYARIRLLNKGIEELTETERLILKLYINETNFNYSKLGRMLHCSHATARTYILNLESKLKNNITENDDTIH